MLDRPVLNAIRRARESFFLGIFSLPGNLEARRSLIVPISLTYSILSAIILLFDWYTQTGAQPSPVLLFLLLPWGILINRFFWWAGWVLTARIVILSTVYIPPFIEDGSILFASGYMLSLFVASQIYGVSGVAGATFLQILAMAYHSYGAPDSVFSSANLGASVTMLLLFSLLLGFSEHVRDYLFEEVRTQERRLKHAYHETLIALADALQLRDNETAEHSERVAELTLQVALAFRFSDEERTHIQRGAILHDIGKIGVPDAILRKPGALNEEEWAQMRQHPLLAVKVLERVEFLRPALPIPRWHHERWDGKGYPDGLKGEEIPLEARIFSVVDAFDAITNNRPYRHASTAEEAIQIIKMASGSAFDPLVVHAFERVVAKQHEEGEAVSVEG